IIALSPFVPVQANAIEKTPAQGGSAEVSLAMVILGWSALPGPRLLRPTRNWEVNRPPPRRFHAGRGSGRSYHPRLSTMVPRAPPVAQRRRKGRRKQSALFVFVAGVRLVVAYFFSVPLSFFALGS